MVRKSGSSRGSEVNCDKATNKNICHKEFRGPVRNPPSRKWELPDKAANKNIYHPHLAGAWPGSYPEENQSTILLLIQIIFTEPASKLNGLNSGAKRIGKQPRGERAFLNAWLVPHWGRTGY